MKTQISLLKSVLVGTLLLRTAVAGHGAVLKFDGGDDYVQLGASGVVLGTNYTQEAWIYPQFTDVNYHAFIGNEASGGYAETRSPSMYVVGQTMLHVGFGTGSQWINSMTTNVLRLNAWNHVATTYDSTALRVYVNGQLVHSLSTTAVPANYPVQNFGRIRDSLFPGMIDEVRLWNLARTAPQIAAFWNRRLVGNETNLVAYYPMDEAAGTMTADASGHGYTGSLVNGPLWNTAEDAVAPVPFTRPATVVTNTSVQLNALVKPQRRADHEPLRVGRRLHRAGV